jgi:predicted  nucleic acid-binding Zn-ribbon protein
MTTDDQIKRLKKEIEICEDECDRLRRELEETRGELLVAEKQAGEWSARVNELEQELDEARRQLQPREE